MCSVTFLCEQLDLTIFGNILSIDYLREVSNKVVAPGDWDINGLICAIEKL